jgi:hypothetical protein
MSPLRWASSVSSTRLSTSSFSNMLCRWVDPARPFFNITAKDERSALEQAVKAPQRLPVNLGYEIEIGEVVGSASNGGAVLS